MLGLGPVPKQTVFSTFQIIGRKPITYENSFPMKKMLLLSENQVKYVEDIIVKIDTENLWISRREVIRVKSYLRQAESFVQAEYHLDYLIQAKRMKHLKRLGRVVASQATTTEQSQIFVSQQYCWQMIVEADLEDLPRTKSPCDIFICYAQCVLT